MHMVPPTFGAIACIATLITIVHCFKVGGGGVANRGIMLTSGDFGNTVLAVYGVKPCFMEPSVLKLY